MYKVQPPTSPLQPERCTLYGHSYSSRYRSHGPVGSRGRGRLHTDYRAGRGHMTRTETGDWPKRRTTGPRNAGTLCSSCSSSRRREDYGAQGSDTEDGRLYHSARTPAANCPPHAARRRDTPCSGRTASPRGSAARAGGAGLSRRHGNGLHSNSTSTNSRQRHGHRRRENTRRSGAAVCGRVWSTT